MKKHFIYLKCTIIIFKSIFKNQGFILNNNIIGLQFHFESSAHDIKEIIMNDASYVFDSVLNQTPEQILNQEVPRENKEVMFKLLDFITSH